MKYTKNERLLIGREIYTHELTISKAAEKYQKSPTMIFGFLIVGLMYVCLSYPGIGNFKFGFGFIIMF